MHPLRSIVFSALALAPPALAQEVKGVVTALEGGETLPAANVHWIGTTIGTATDQDGAFAIPAPGRWPARLVASFVGYKPDTLLLKEPPTAPLRFTLRWAVEIGPVEVVERVQGTQLSTRTINATEIIGQKELKRAACCDLSESFETNATVDASFSDAISGSKVLRMLGLDGKYAQLSVENLPFVRGLSASSGLTLIPGTWIHAINLSKGAGTAVNGPNAITGQIDLCLLNPLDEPPLFVNLYGNSQGRAEANVHARQRIGPHATNLLLVHGNWFNTEMDQNRDGFMDMPRTRRINVMDRFMHAREGRTTQVAVRHVEDIREGGSTFMHLEGPPDHHAPYVVDIRNAMTDLLAKHGFVFRNDATRSLGFVTALRRHHLTARFGERRHEGLQLSGYVSGIYQQLARGGKDQLKAGLSLQVDDFEETFQDSSFARNEVMPGLFTEYTLQAGDVAVVAGVRADRNSWYGTVASPRLHAKWDIGPLTVARASVGHGFRSTNPLVENAAVLASSRRVVVENEPGLERAWTFGAGALHKFKWIERRWAVGLDAYHTRFTTQLVADLDRSPQLLVFYMLDGPSYATSVLADVQVELSRTLDLKLSYRWYDVATTYDGVLRERPFTPPHRGLVDLAWASPNERWRADVSVNLFSRSRIPWTTANPEPYRFPRRSPAYATLHAQVTFIWRAWEFYLGGENLTSAGQTRQIIAPEDPYGPYFDASLIWGPTVGAMIYGGLRYTLRPTKNPS